MTIAYPENAGTKCPSRLAALSFFDPGTGWLAVRNGNAIVTVAANGDLVATLDGQQHSASPADTGYDPAMGGANVWSLRGISLVGGPDGELTLDGIVAAGDLSVQTNGSVLMTGANTVAGQLVVAAAKLDIQGDVGATALNLTSAGLLNVDGGAWLAAPRIEVAANYFVNVGQVRADGATGGSVTVSARADLNAGTVSA